MARRERKTADQTKDMTQAEIQKVFDTLGLTGNLPMSLPSPIPPGKDLQVPYFPVSGSTAPPPSDG